MSGLLNDLRFGLRQLIKRPGFAAAAILTLALGIGANTAVFSVLNGYLLKPLPYPRGDRLVQIDVSEPKINLQFSGVSIGLYKAIGKSVTALSGSAIYTSTALNLQANGKAMRINGMSATASLFGVLKVKPLLGHRFTAGNEQPGRGQVAVLSYALWQKIFGGDPQAIGKTFRLDSRIYRVIGVMPKSFAFPDRTTDLWVPVTITPGDLSANRLITLNYQFIGRLKDGATLTAVAQQLKSVRRFVKQSAGADWRDLQNIGFAMTARPFHQVLLGDRTAILLLLQGAVLLVLLITCANVANLLLARTLGRTHELAMRMALGANWARLARQLLVEGLCLAVPGGLAGVALGWLALRFVGDSGLVAAGEVFGVTPDWRVGLFALAVVCATGVLVSLLPIFHLSQTELQTLLQEGNRSMSSGRHSRRIRNTLVMTELALATALLAGAGLLLHSFANLEAVNPGFNKDHVLITGLLVPREDHRSDAALSNFYAGLLTRVRQLPGVEQAGIATHAPFSAWVPVINLKVRGYRSAPGVAPPTAAQVFVGGAFFKALGIPILRGRAFNSRDTAKSQPVAIINQQLAKRYFGDKNPIGKRIRSSYPFQWYTIVGVVPTVKTKRLDKKQTFNMLYLSAAQHPDRTMRLIVKTATPPNLLTKPLKELVEKTDSAVAVFGTQTMRQRLADQLQNQRATAILVIAFGGIALALAMVGVYGVLSYAVGQRKTECGIRLAMGAQPSDLLWLFIKAGLRLLVVGLISGLCLAVLFGFVMSSQLFSVAPFDPVTLAGTAVALTAVTSIACYLPARRAAKLDPAVAMMEQ